MCGVVKFVSHYCTVYLFIYLLLIYLFILLLVSSCGVFRSSFHEATILTPNVFCFLFLSIAMFTLFTLPRFLIICPKYFSTYYQCCCYWK